MWTKQYTSLRPNRECLPKSERCILRSPIGAGWSATDLRYRLAEVQSIPTADLAATSSFQKRLRQFVNLSEKSERAEGGLGGRGRVYSFSCSCRNKVLRGLQVDLATVGCSSRSHAPVVDLRERQAGLDANVELLRFGRVPAMAKGREIGGFGGG